MDLLVLVLALTLAQTLVLALALLLLLHLGCSRKFQLGRSGYTKGGPWEQCSVPYMHARRRRGFADHCRPPFVDTCTAGA